MEDFYKIFKSAREANDVSLKDLAPLVFKTEGALRTALSRKSLNEMEMKTLFDAVHNPQTTQISDNFISTVVERFEDLKKNPAFQNLIKIERLEAREELMRELMAKPPAKHSE